MTDKKIARTPKRAPATRKADTTQVAPTEQTTIFNHLIRGENIHTDLAFQLYGTKHLHSVIPTLELRIPIERKAISRPHPITKIIREVNVYWVNKSVIISFYKSNESREEMRKQQVSLSIAKARDNNNKTLVKMCSYCLKSTMINKLDVIYGGQAANDD